MIRRHLITTLVLKGSGSLRVGKRIEDESFALSETDDDGDCRIRIASTDETSFYMKIHINRHNSFRNGGKGGGQQKSHLKFQSSKAVHVHQNCTCCAGFYKVIWLNQIFLQETSLRNLLSWYVKFKIFKTKRNCNYFSTGRPVYRTGFQEGIIQPARSSDLTSPNFFTWEYVNTLWKHKGSMWERIYIAITTTSPDMLPCTRDEHEYICISAGLQTMLTSLLIDDARNLWGLLHILNEHLVLSHTSRVIIFWNQGVLFLRLCIYSCLTSSREFRPYKYYNFHCGS